MALTLPSRLQRRDFVFRRTVRLAMPKAYLLAIARKVQSVAAKSYIT
jgi:hypothetical protein